MSQCNHCKFYDASNEKTHYTNYRYSECSKVKQQFRMDGLPVDDYNVCATEDSCHMFVRAVGRKVRFNGDKTPVIMAIIDGKERDYVLNEFGISLSLYYKLTSGRLWKDEFEAVKATYSCA